MDDIDQRFRAAYWSLVHYVETLRLRVWEERGLTLPQLRVLFLVRAQPGVTTNVLARHLGLTMATVSGLVNKLVQAGLVGRGQRASDRRFIPLTLTEEGTGTVGTIREGNRALLTALEAQIGPDLERVTETLELLAAGIEQVRDADGEAWKRSPV
jgi:DNA-binding MarR family transcriptional regulator